MAKKILTHLVFIFVLLGSLFSLPVQASLFEGSVSTPTAIHHFLEESPKNKDGTPKYFVVAELGIVYLHPDFLGFKNIIVENSQNSTVLTPTAGNIEPDYPDQFAQTMTLQAFLNNHYHWTVAMKTILPLNSLAQLDTGSIYQPEYVLYRSEMQRPQIIIFTGVDATEDIRLGAGLEIGFNATAQANLFLHAGNGTYSDQRLTIQMKPTYTPWLGLEAKNISFTVRGESKSTVDMNAIASARVFSSVNAGIPFSYNSSSALFFVPWTFELQGAIPLSDEFKLNPSISYQMWSRFQPPAAIIAEQVPINCQGGGTCNTAFSASRKPDYQAQDVIVPALGFEWFNGDLTVRSGYRYKGSIFKTLPTGFGNYLDPPRHDVLFGVKIPVMSNWEFSLHFQLSKLTEQTVVKSNPTTDIGGPQYTAGGWLYGGGMSIAVPF